jgi:hypothetical protein
VTAAQVEFTTGEQNTTATVYCHTPSPDTAAIFDDVSLLVEDVN